MKRLSLLLAAWVALLPAAVAHGQAGMQLDDQALAGERGGILTAGGLDIGFAATVHTYVDGQLALESKLTWTATGAVVERSTGPAVAGVTVQSAGPATGAPIILAGGATTILHDLSGSRIASLVVNTANNRAIRQDTDIVLNLPQLPQLQQQMAQDRIASELQSSLAAALSLRTGR